MSLGEFFEPEVSARSARVCRIATHWEQLGVRVGGSHLGKVEGALCCSIVDSVKHQRRSGLGEGQLWGEEIINAAIEIVRQWQFGYYLKDRL